MLVAIMKRIKEFFFIIFVVLFSQLLIQCNYNAQNNNVCKIIFLHHSTGEAIWRGDSKSIQIKGIHLGAEYDVPKWFINNNITKGTSYQISERTFPNAEPYGWQNYPYDYYNIWVKNAGNKTYMGEPTLEMLAKDYKVIIFKHCYPVSILSSDSTKIDINSTEKTIENYKLQYNALKQKLLQFPHTKFILWTGPVMVQSQLSESNAQLTRSFFDWVRATWDTENDNIFLWDFYELETEGGMYLKPEYATSPTNSHPNKDFAQKVVPYFCQRIVDVIENNGANTTLSGIYK
jgi:hypothetical protein